ncbi:MAG: rhomboid family intramembrane serine protease [Alistipes sp.]
MNRYFQTPPVVLNLIIINVLVFMATALLPVGNLLTAYGSLFWFSNPLYHSYQFISYMFLHANFEHLFFNMFALWMFGRTLEQELGSQRFLTYYMVCGVGAALLQMLAVWVSGEYYVQLLGASGAVMGLLLAFGVMHPNVPIIFIFLPIPIKAKWFVAIYAVVELFMGWTGYGGNVAHFAHVGGMLWGFLLLYWWKKRGTIWY